VIRRCISICGAVHEQHGHEDSRSGCNWTHSRYVELTPLFSERESQVDDVICEKERSSFAGDGFEVREAFDCDNSGDA
jgi:hypothetical protein